MRNAGLSEARCQNEVSESKAPAASNVTSKVRSRRVTEFSPSRRCALWWLQDRQSGGRVYRGQTHKYFKVDAGDCRLLVMASVSSTTATFLECGGKRSATPLSSGSQASRITWRPGGSHQVGKSAVPASLCRRSPKKCDKKMSPNRFRRQLANDVPQNPVNASKEIIVLKSAR